MAEKVEAKAEGKAEVAGTLKEQVEKVLGRIRPNLQADGGDVQLVEVTDGTVKVKLVGACMGCPMSTLTLKMGIERMLKNEIPSVKEVIAVAN